MEQTLIYNDHSVYYRTLGKGSPVVLIHGFAEDGQIWKYQEQALESRVRLIIPDLPGCGQSEPSGNMSMEYLADVIKAILDKEEAGPAILIGHSMGGYITLAFAEKYPQLLNAFALFHSTAYPDTQEKKETRRKSIEFIQKHGSQAFLNQSTPNMFSPGFKNNHPDKISQLIEQYHNFNPDTLTASYEAMIQRPDRTTVLKNIRKPVLFIMGKFDNAIPLKDGLTQCHLPDLSYIHILKESGHMGLWEEAAESNRVLTEFLVSQ